MNQIQFSNSNDEQDLDPKLMINLQKDLKDGQYQDVLKNMPKDIKLNLFDKMLQQAKQDPNLKSQLPAGIDLDKIKAEDIEEIATGVIQNMDQNQQQLVHQVLEGKVQMQNMNSEQKSAMMKFQQDVVVQAMQNPSNPLFQQLQKSGTEMLEAQILANYPQFAEGLQDSLENKVVSCCFCITVDQPFKNINTQIIQDRLMGALYIYGEQDFSQILELYGPDMYAPFWIYYTIVMNLALAGNIHKELYAQSLQEKQFDFGLLPEAFGLMFGFGTFIPLLIYVMLKYQNIIISPQKVACFYGYSMFIFVPITLSSFLIPYRIIYEIMLIYGVIHQTYFLMKIFKEQVDQMPPTNKYTSLIGIFLLQAYLISSYYSNFYGRFETHFKQ